MALNGLPAVHELADTHCRALIISKLRLFVSLPCPITFRRCWSAPSTQCSVARQGYSDANRRCATGRHFHNSGHCCPASNQHLHTSLCPCQGIAAAHRAARNGRPAERHSFTLMLNPGAPFKWFATETRIYLQIIRLRSGGARRGVAAQRPRHASPYVPQSDTLTVFTLTQHGYI